MGRRQANAKKRGAQRERAALREGKGQATAASDLPVRVWAEGGTAQRRRAAAHAERVWWGVEGRVRQRRAATKRVVRPLAIAGRRPTQAHAQAQAQAMGQAQVQRANELKQRRVVQKQAVWWEEAVAGLGRALGRRSEARGQTPHQTQRSEKALEVVASQTLALALRVICQTLPPAVRWERARPQRWVVTAQRPKRWGLRLRQSSSSRSAVAVQWWVQAGGQVRSALRHRLWTVRW
jgi:hypothetical protein